MNNCNCGLHSTNDFCPVALNNIDILLDILIDMFFLGYAPERFIYFSQLNGFEIINPNDITIEITHMLAYVLQTYRIKQNKKEVLQILNSYFSTIEQVKINELNFLKELKKKPKNDKYNKQFQTI